MDHPAESHTTQENDIKAQNHLLSDSGFTIQTAEGKFSDGKAYFEPGASGHYFDKKDQETQAKPKT